MNKPSMNMAELCIEGSGKANDHLGSTNHQPVRSCNLCQRRGLQEAFITCPACRAIFYCSEACRKHDLVHRHDDHGHATWCSRMAMYMFRSDDLANLPFTFADATTASDFTEHKLRLFLESYHVYNRGYWRHLCPRTSCLLKKATIGAATEESNMWVLSSEGSLLESPGVPVAPSVPLQDWAQYYKWRGFELDSPIAALLQFPLTVYYIVSSLLPKQFALHRQEVTSFGDQFTIHLLGVEQEADMVPLFAELGALIPNRTFNIVMIGPKISKKLDRKVVEMRNVTVTLHRGLHHDVDIETPADVVIGLNAGLAAYPTWLETLTGLSRSRTPAYFTDYCQYSCECSRLPLEALHLGTISEVAMNPFRSPLRKYCEEHDMPWYSNAFVYHLVYAS